MKKFCMQNLLITCWAEAVCWMWVVDQDPGSINIICLAGRLMELKLIRLLVSAPEDLALPYFREPCLICPLDQKYDVITFNHIIEHVLNPVETIEAAKNLLVPGGLLILLLPNLDSHGFRIYGDCWFPLDPPRHILQFSPKTMRDPC